MKTINETKKCKSCGGSLFFSPILNNDGVLICEKCNSAISIVANKNFSKHSIENLSDLNNKNFSSTGIVNCQSCGANVVESGLEYSKSCPYCGTNLVMDNADDTSLKPDAIIPFKIPKNNIADVYKKTIKKKWFLPNKLKKMSR